MKNKIDLNVEVKSTFKLKRIIREIIKEVGDLKNTNSFQFNKENDYSYNFKLSETNVCNVLFEDFIYSEEDITFVKQLNDFGNWAKLAWEDKEVFNVEYNIDEKTISAIQLNLKEYNQILITVLSIIEDFIKNKNPDLLFIGSLNYKKQKHFNAIIAHNIEQLENWDYSISVNGIALFNSQTIK